MEPAPGVPWDRDARPGPDAVLALRRIAWAVSEGLTDERLAARTTPVAGPGYRDPDSHPVAGCLRTVPSEERGHRRSAERDLAVLRGRTAT